MESERQQSHTRFTVDEIGERQDGVLLATLVSDDGESLTMPLNDLPVGTRVGDVLLPTFQLDPDERTRRRAAISDLQKRLFG